jgi:hypothetical protein
MDITLSWDLVLTVFIIIVVAMSYLLGKHQCVKLVLAAYVSMVTVQGVAAVFGRASPDWNALQQNLAVNVDDHILSTAKLLLFVLVTVLIALRGGISVSYEKEALTVTNVIAAGLLCCATAGLMLVTVVTFIADVPLLSPLLAFSPVLKPLLGQSWILWTVTSFQDLFYTVPAVLVLVIGFHDQWK